jgi:soluble lytic murein transglycosylase-like protein
MERAEDLSSSAAIKAKHEAATIAAVENAKRAIPPIFTAVSVANLVLLGALVWSNRNISGSVEEAHVVLQNHANAVQEVKTEVAALAERSTKLEQEVQKLSEVVSTSSGEDVLFLKIVITKREIDRKLARQIAHYVHKYSRIYGQDPDLVLAIIAVESDFNPKVKSSAGALGLMQIMPQWKQVLGIREDLTDVETSIRYGLQVLGFYRNMYGDLEMALTAYNRGPGPVDHALNKGVSPHNKYAPRVLMTYKELRSLKVGREIG